MSATIAQLRAELDEARALLARVFIAEWKEDSCPYGCTGNKCPWCGAQQHVSGHEHGCLIPEARAFLDLCRDEARGAPDVTIERGCGCVFCDIDATHSAEECTRDWGAPLDHGCTGPCGYNPKTGWKHAATCPARAAPTESGPLMEGQKFYPDGKLVTEFVRAPEPPRCACPVSQWRGPDEHTDPECPARTGRVKK